MLRFVDKEAIEIIRDICSRPGAYALESGTAALAFIDGFTTKRSKLEELGLGCFFDFLGKHCGFDSNVYVLPSMRKKFQKLSRDETLSFLLSVVDKFSSLKIECAGCGLTIADAAPIRGPISPPYHFHTWRNAKFFHAECARNTDCFAAPWKDCTICHTELIASDLAEAAAKLQLRIDCTAFEPYGLIAWRYLFVDRDKEFLQIYKTISADIPIVGRLHQLRKIKAASQAALHMQFPKGVPIWMKECFEPVHASCVATQFKS